MSQAEATRVSPLSSAPLPPVVRHGIPRLGPVIAFGRDPIGFLEDCRRRYGDVFTLDFLLYRLTMTTGEEGQAQFFRAKDEDLSLSDAMDQFVGGVLGPEPYGGLDEEQIRWGHEQLRRGLMQDAALSFYLTQIESEARAAFARWAELGTIDLFPEVSRLVTRANLRCFLGEDALSRFGDELAGSYMDIERDGTSPLAMLAPRLPSPPVRRAAAARRRISGMVDEILTARRALSKEEQAQRRDYLQMWLNAGVVERGSAGLRHVVIHWLSLLFAAHTNTVGTLAWTLVRLLQHPAALGLALAEQQRVGPLVGADLSYGRLKELTYLDACMKETSRHFFTLMLVRRSKRQVPIGRYRVPAGSLVAVSPILLHRDGGVFPQPEAYRPERWLDDATRRDLISRNVYVQFGYGPHRCLGEMFAGAVIKTAGSLLLREHELTLLDRDPRPDWTKAVGTPFPLRPVRVRCQRRPAAPLPV